MQHIPHHSLEDLESSRADMQDFRENLNKEKHVWPDMALTGEDIHNAFCAVSPDHRHWAEVPEIAKQLYNKVATELNRELDARQAWFEVEDRVTINAVRCPTCNEMLDSEHAEGHACWEKTR